MHPNTTADAYSTDSVVLFQRQFKPITKSLGNTKYPVRFLRAVHEYLLLTFVLVRIFAVSVVDSMALLTEW